ncbi:MAG TPA: serine hydrolase domain-containing protein [Thermoanaerobaculia bacterium]|nr:serine hydrolase domain-containing protein [Thermoanaerobaculia bacterium]
MTRSAAARHPLRFCALATVLLAIGAAAPGESQEAPDAGLPSSVERVARRILAETGVPSASIGVVQNGRVVLLKAYGNAKLQPPVPARPEMRYPIGSISKQFTATAILLLADERKLSLDDRVARFLPDLAHSGEVSIRQLLSHTSGYQDFWPQDYVPPFMLKDVTAEQILDRWAKKPLDFPPGTQWQYSNTNFVIAGLIVEKISGLPLMQFLQEREFAPLGMRRVMSIDRERLGDSDATGYLRYGLGPHRPAPKEGKGWLFAMGELAMTAEDLAKWDIGLMEHRLLSPASYAEMEREVLLANGLGAKYGLGIDVSAIAGHRALSHGGEVSGFTATNIVFPDDRAAICVLTNQDAVGGSSKIAEEIAPKLFSSAAETAAAEALARRVFESFQAGRIDRSLFTENANAYFDATALKDLASSLGPLGRPTGVEQAAQRERGGMTFRRFKITFAKKKLEVAARLMPDGKIEQYQITAGD